jgi:hypothetical protein
MMFRYSIRVVMQRLLKLSSLAAVAAAAGTLLGGCAVTPANRLPGAAGTGDLMKQVMGRKDKIVHLSPETDRNKPVLLLLHGATEDPSEMMDIASAWTGTYDVFLYSYNYHERVEKVAAGLATELKGLECRNRLAANMTVIAYSYAAIVFRAAVVMTEDKAVFSGVSLVQLVPSAGGSYLARGMKYPGVAALVSLASNPSVASNPYGSFARRVWEGNGNREFYEVIQSERLHTILVEGDSHSLARVKDEQVRRRYQNGIGPNVAVIPKSTGVSHEYFPTHPVGLAYLKTILELPPGNSAFDQTPVTHPPELETSAMSRLTAGEQARPKQ